MSKIILVQSSLNPNSRTAIVVQKAGDLLNEMNYEIEIIDLRDYEIPFCDGRPLSEYGGDTLEIHEKLKTGDAFIIGFPVYMYSFSGVLKNFLDILSGPFVEKYCGIIANAGGLASYLSSAELIKLLSFDLDMTSIQPTVYSHKKHFQDGQLTDDYIIEKLKLMLKKLVKAADLEPSIKESHDKIEVKLS